MQTNATMVKRESKNNKKKQKRESKNNKKRKERKRNWPDKFKDFASIILDGWNGE